MDIDVDQLWIDADVNYSHRMAPALEPALIALFQGVHECTRADRPPVHREHDAVPAATTQTRLAHHSGGQGHAGHLQHLGRDRRAKDRSDGASPVTVARRAYSDSSIDREVKPDVWMKHRKCADHILHRCNFSRIALQELQAGRNICKEVSDLERDTGQQRP